MARFELEFKASVAKDTRNIPAEDPRKILRRIEALCADPWPPGSTKLAGSDCHRVRQGNYRIIYQVIAQRLVIVVIKIGHRREVYR